ncbi:MAG: hypothetical protein QOF16_1055 [Actinomycetota bacterium]|nr:hypothetical protein [Actinomycetota bacterium]
MAGLMIVSMSATQAFASRSSGCVADVARAGGVVSTGACGTTHTFRVAIQRSRHHFIDPTCPLSGLETTKAIMHRPAVAVKVENDPAAYPLSGLDKADLVVEEPVEGGMTRFAAFFHCNDASMVGPIRSARATDPSIIQPITSILAAAGANQIVSGDLDAAGVFTIDETTAGAAMQRVDRPGYAVEHTLFGDSAALRAVGLTSYQMAPPRGILPFGTMEGRSRPARQINMSFGGADTIHYQWVHGQYLRSDGGAPLMMSDGEQLGVDNVLVEMRTVYLSTALGDANGVPSPEFGDVPGHDQAVLFRNGRAIAGTWQRRSEDGRTVFRTRSGDQMNLRPGNTVIEMVPNHDGDVSGSLSFRG